MISIIFSKISFTEVHFTVKFKCMGTSRYSEGHFPNGFYFERFFISKGYFSDFFLIPKGQYSEDSE